MQPVFESEQSAISTCPSSHPSPLLPTSSYISPSRIQFSRLRGRPATLPLRVSNIAPPSATPPPPSERCGYLLLLHPFIPRMPLPSSVSFPAILLSRLSSDHFSQVGIATQLPSGTHLQDNLDYTSYWNFLLNQHDAYQSLPPERLGGISYVPNALSHAFGLALIFHTALPHPHEAPSLNTSIDSTT